MQRQATLRGQITPALLGMGAGLAARCAGVRWGGFINPIAAMVAIDAGGLQISHPRQVPGRLCQIITMRSQNWVLA